MNRLAVTLVLLFFFLLPGVGCAGRQGGDDRPPASQPLWPPQTTPSCKGPWRKEPTIMAMPTERGEDILFWVRFAIEDVPAGAYLEVQGQPQMEAAMRASMPFLFRWTPEANPYAPDRPATHCFHIGEAEGDRDVLRHRYEAHGLTLDVFESAEIVLTWVDLPPVAPAATLAAAQGIAAILFTNGSERLHFVPYRASDELARFSTAPSGALGAPFDKPYQIDGGIRDGRLFFVLHKLPGALGHYGKAMPSYPPYQGWLGAPLRAAWDARPGPR